MKRLYILLQMILISHLAFNQEFSFSMYFEDAIGNRDTLIIGYDDDATDSIDANFNEINIIDLPLDSLFDVRISNIHIVFYQYEESTFHTKKQIHKKNCGTYFSVNAIEIHCLNWPVTATWDKSKLNTICLEGSVFTSCPPGGWYDVAGPSDLNYVEMANIDSVTFTSNFYGDDLFTAYVNNEGTVIPVFWQALGDKRLIEISVDQISNDKELLIYPNPIKTNSRLNILTTYKLNEKIKIFNLLGLSKVIEIKNKTIDISDLEPGIYFIMIRSIDDKKYIEKLIIN